MLMQAVRIIVIGITVSVGFISCGKEEFIKQEFTSSAQAPGFRSLPAKLDVVIVPDNSGSITSGFTTIQNQLGSFVSELQSKNWDYHLMRSMMINPSPITRMLVNPDFNSTTLPDGTPNPNLDLVPASFALTSVNQILPLLDAIDGSTGARDDTYANTFSTIRNAMANTSAHFFRQDALLAIIIITNGAEYSVDPNHNGSLDLDKLQDWADAYKGLKGSPELLRVYPIAASSFHSGTNGDNCLVSGGKSYIGTSYTRLLEFGISGFSADFCNASAISKVLSDIEKDLTDVKESFVFTRIVLDQEPVPSSIKVFKNGAELPQDAGNGWTYAGGPQTVFTVTGILNANGNVKPFNAISRTGWVIELHGSGQFLGTDSANIDYQRP